MAKQIPMLHFVDARHADFVDPDRDLPSEMDVVREDSSKCDSLESNFSALAEDPERDAFVPSPDEPEVIEDVEVLQSNVENRASVGYPFVVGNSQWYVRRFSTCVGPSPNRFCPSTAEDFSFVRDNSVGSYSMLEDARPARDAGRTDFSFMTSGGGRCKPLGMRPMKDRNEVREEDGFVVL